MKPLVNPLTETAKFELTQDERIARLEDRMTELEGILTDYFLGKKRTKSKFLLIVENF